MEQTLPGGFIGSRDIVFATFDDCGGSSCVEGVARRWNSSPVSREARRSSSRASNKRQCYPIFCRSFRKLNERPSYSLRSTATAAKKSPASRAYPSVRSGGGFKRLERSSQQTSRASATANDGLDVESGSARRRRSKRFDHGREPNRDPKILSGSRQEITAMLRRRLGWIAFQLELSFAGSPAWFEPEDPICKAT